jgi:hypothetical protein
VKGEKTFKAGDYVKTDRGEIGRVTFFKEQPDGYANVYRLIDVEANDPYASTFLENGNFINGTRLKAYKQRKPNPGLYENINAKRARIAAGSGERMRKPGSKGAPTQEAFEQSALTAKRNPATKSNDIYVVQFEALPGNFQDAGAFVKGIPLYFKSLESAKKAAKKVSNTVTFNDDEVRIVKIDKPKEFLQSYRDMGYFDRKTNPDKSKPRAYVKRASQATGAPPSKRLVSRRKMALKAPAGYFPNPKAAMMTGYQVICMHPKKHVYGIFKTMAEAMQVAVAMADAKNVPYAVKTVKVHKAHFAV